MIRTFAGLGVGALGIAALLTACSGKPSVGGESCASNEDCRNGQRCEDRVCVIAAEADAGNKPRTDASTPAPDAGASCTVGDRKYTLPACASCLESKCCAELAACGEGTDCKKLETCLDGCNDASCKNVCVANFSKGVTPFNDYISCALGADTCRTSCRPQSKIGYACSYDSDCLSGSCAGSASEPGWCTTTCSVNADCGYGNKCVLNGNNQKVCFPGCTYDSQCRDTYDNPKLRCNTSYWVCSS